MREEDPEFQLKGFDRRTETWTRIASGSEPYLRQIASHQRTGRYARFKICGPHGEYDPLL